MINSSSYILFIIIWFLPGCSKKIEKTDNSARLVNIVHDESTRFEYLVNGNFKGVTAYTSREELGTEKRITIGKHKLEMDRSSSTVSLGSKAEVIVDFSSPRSVFFLGERFFTGAEDIYVVSGGLQAVTDKDFKGLTKKIEDMYGIKILPIFDSDGALIGPGCIGVRALFNDDKKVEESMVIIFVPDL